jgi:hypothetical protein
MLADLEINLGNIWPSINGLHLNNELGYGLEFFHFNGADIGFTNEIMIIGQGLRLYLSDYLEISSRYKRREDELVGGRDYSLFYFEHGIRSKVNRLFAEMQFTHGQGFRLKVSAGYAL